MDNALDFDDINFPFISLLVSGGHSLIIDVKGLGEYSILGYESEQCVIRQQVANGVAIRMAVLSQYLSG